MGKVKSTLIKFLSVAFSVCCAFAIISMPKVSAQAVADFSVNQSATIKVLEDDGRMGIKFSSSVNGAWLSENASDKYTFGTLIYPTAKESLFDATKTATENVELVDAVDVIYIKNKAVTGDHNFDASIIFDKEVVIRTIEAKGLEATDDLIDSVIASLYNRDFTARAYAVVNGEYVYADTYSTSMYKVASKTYALGEAENNEAYKTLALSCFKSANEQDASVKFVDNVLDGDYTVTEKAMVLCGNAKLENGVDYTIDENGKIVFPADYTKLGKKESLFIIENGALTVAKVTYGTDVKSVSEVLSSGKADETVVVKGYFAGVSVDNLVNYGTQYFQLLIKDTENDKIISFNSPNNLDASYGITKGGNSYGFYYEDIINIKYEKGDYIVLKGTFRTSSTNNANRKDVVISSENPSDINKTIISKNNILNYSFKDAILLDEWDDWDQVVDPNFEAYTYVRIKGTLYSATQNLSDYSKIRPAFVAQGLSSTEATNATVNVVNNQILHMNASAGDTKANMQPTSGQYVILKRLACNINLGDNWSSVICGGTTGLEVDMYALFTGGSTSYNVLTPLEFNWLTVHDHVYDDGEEIGTCTVSGCGYKHYHKYNDEWQTETLSTVISTGVEYRTCTFDGCNKKEYRDTEKAKAVSIAVTTNPEKMFYNSGDKFDATGMIVTATGDNGSTCDITSLVTIEDKQLSNEDFTLTISYEGLTTTISVNMVAEHTHTFENEGEIITDSTFTETGIEEKSCTFEGCGEKKQEEIPKKVATSIEITSVPNRLTYFVYESFDKAGLKVTGYDANGYSEDITDIVTITSSQIVLGANTVTITYGDLVKTFTVTGVVANVSDVRFNVADGTKVLVEGYYVGVADEGYQGDKELLIKDINTDDIIAVRGVSYDTLDNNYGYTYGDKLRFIAELKVDGTTYTTNKKYLNFSDENGDKASTIISSGNAVNYSFNDAVELNNYHAWDNVFTLNSESYTYVHITGLLYSSKFKGSDNINSLVLSSFIGFTGSYSELKVNSRLVSLRYNAMDANLGSNWLDFFAEDYLTFNSSSSYKGPGYLKEVDMYAVFTGTTSGYYQLTILSEDWIEEIPSKSAEDFTSNEIIREVGFSYYRQNTQIQYNQTMTRRNLYAKPEDATSQHLIYLDCSSFVGSVIKEALGINLLPDSVINTYIEEGSGLTYSYPTTARLASYAKFYNGNPSYPDIIKYYSKSNFDTEAEVQQVAKELAEGLQMGDIINYRKKGNSSGHVMIYIGNGLFIHSQGKDYQEGKTNPSSAVDGAYGYEALDGTIGFLTLYDVLYNTSHTRYIVSTSQSDNISWFRPLNRADAKVTDSALLRVEYRGIDAEKTLDAGVNTSVQKGQTLTYTVTVENHSATDYKGVEFKEVLDSNVTLVEAPEGYTLNDNVLTFKVDVPHYKFTTFTYKVKVKDTATNGAIIRSEQTTFAGISLARIANTVSSYTTDELNAVANKAKGYASSGTSFENMMDIVSSLYGDLGITAFDKYTTIDGMFDELFDTTEDVLNDVEIASYVAPNLFGGRDMINTYLRSNDSIRLIQEHNLSIGDIILAEFDLYNGTSKTATKTGNIVRVAYVYVGNSQLVCLTDDANHVAFTNGTASAGAGVNKCFTITIGSDIRKNTNTLVSIFTYDRWVVLRPY